MKTKSVFWALICLTAICVNIVNGSEQDFPVLYKGRFRPADAYARLWLYEPYHSQVIRNEDLTLFKTQSSSALEWLWQLDLAGHIPYDSAPLFWITSADLKQLAHLDPLKNRFSYLELTHSLYHDPATSQAILNRLIAYHYWNALSEASNRGQSEKLELNQLLPGLWVQQSNERLLVTAAPSQSPWPFLKTGYTIDHASQHERSKDRKLADALSHLIQDLRQFSQIEGANGKGEAFKIQVSQLQMLALSPKQIEASLEKEYPLLNRLKNAGMLFKALPSRYNGNDWFSLHALKLQVYDRQSNSLKPIGNFTLYSNEEFEAIRQAYLAFEKELSNPNTAYKKNHSYQELVSALKKGYEQLAGTPFQEAAGKALYYPTFNQLKAESWYYHYSWIKLLIALYALSCLLLICLSKLPPSSWFKKGVIGLLLATFALHTVILLWRCYILNRPPVSNMFETVIYVPWVAVLSALTLTVLRRNPFVLPAASLASMLLLILLELTDLNHSLDQVQAVLDSQFWLLIHVLMVVGSYGVFILGSILGHFYLGSYLYHRAQTKQAALLAQLILQTLYVGTALLITGTILGGIWAAESWGRFWDWDPKESWAFISSCLYLIWIHAYRFHRIGNFGLAFGAVSGFLAISFTWYGVNYILGTGLHSYGFGSGGEGYYYAYLLAEALFLAAALWVYRSGRASSQRLST